MNENHQSSQSVWLIYYKSTSELFNLSWSQAVDEALCFGWIDSRKKSIDNERFKQLFTKRKAGSSWSKINKKKVERLIKENLMTQAGHEAILLAKQHGNWSLFDQVEQLMVPKDLETALAKLPNAKELFDEFSPSAKKAILAWIQLAKKIGLLLM
ncbi:YdeI/OmpD-associated family protein [Reichenbachiella agariperforans]|uniref:YdeI/OmpD-associated family protein n=1 Tax=Reichenbachiella agariperforans TaxID=156994 RepID=UPI001C09CBB6|nr:YdeI/OmpD-associated family protein [Reichenbachiella agariperforans]MBU2913719.1 YdeI/OmpD-associated family protein [Reichenbachiella agariperforans]